MKYLFGIIFLSIITVNYALLPEEKPVENSKPVLSDIWYQGKAEISTFELKQNRYNAIHDGEMVMIYVTEDFLADKQVKNDTYTSDNSVPILKNNRIRNFNTGIYDYSVFTSVFTDVSDKASVNTYKVTLSSQDWCGQSFAQLNNLGRYNKISTYSYFEKEGDSETKVKDVLLIDEIFNLIRFGNDYLPEGDVEVMPSFLFARLKHVSDAIYSAQASLSINEDSLSSYTIEIPSLKYKLEINFNDNEQRDILALKESYPSAFDGKVRTTEAIRKSIIWSDYWSRNSPSDSSIRTELKLD